MAFKGTLDTLSMIDVFQVIHMARKAGCLVVQHPDGETKRLYFDGGEVVTATSNGAKDRLGAILIKMGILSQEQVDASRQDEQRTGVKQGQALLEGGLLTQAQLDGALARQVAEIFYSVMIWRAGSFEFVEKEQPGPDVFRVRESVQNLIMQGTRQFDEWGIIEKVFPDLDAVVSMTPPKDGGANLHLQPDEWQILTMIDGHRSIREICELSSLSNFDVCKKLLNLHHAGLVATGAIKPQTSAPPPPVVAVPKVSARFFPQVRAEFTRLVGPIAGILLDEVSETLGVPIAELPLARVPELTKLLCSEIDAPDKRAHLRELIGQAAEA